MDGDGAVAEEGADAWDSGGVRVNVVCGVVISYCCGVDAAMLAGEVTDLTGLRELGVTCWGLGMC